MTIRTPVDQQLESGLSIRQDFRESVRFVMFKTGIEGWPLATHGGTAFIVNYRGRHFGITCKHVLGDFEWSQLRLTDVKFGRASAGMISINYPSDPRAEAIDSDVLDVVVVEFSEDADASFFKDQAYILDTGTVGTSRKNDALLVNGVLKGESTIDSDQVTPTFGLLEFADQGESTFDYALRQAQAVFDNRDIKSVTGISGGPVFNKTMSRLAGVVVRGSLTDGGLATIHYVDIFDVMKVLEAVSNGSLRAKYNKVIVRPLGP